jgi:hypothetical protein
MMPAELQAGFFPQLAGPFTGEALFDCLPEFFEKNLLGSGAKTDSHNTATGP